MTNRIVVVGASTGLGRSMGIAWAQGGDHVALMARSADKLETAAAEGGDTATAIVCDATDPASCEAAFAEAAATMGGIDAVVYTAAIGPIGLLTEATPEEWMTNFSTNVIGANNVTQAALPHITESGGGISYFSTTGASYTGPWAGLGIYHVTKTAMNRLVDQWRLEQPGRTFTVITIGECAGGEGDAQTQFNVGWERSKMDAVVGDWFARGHMSGAFIDIADLSEQVHAVVTAGKSLSIPSITIIPRPPTPDPA